MIYFTSLLCGQNREMEEFFVNRRGIYAPPCVPHCCSLPLTFHYEGNCYSGSLIRTGVSSVDVLCCLSCVWVFLNQRLFSWSCSTLFYSHSFSSQFTTCFWKTKLTPWYLPPPVVHVLYMLYHTNECMLYHTNELIVLGD